MHLFLLSLLVASCISGPVTDERLHSDVDIHEFKEEMKKIGEQVDQEYSAPENLDKSTDVEVIPSEVDEVEKINEKAGFDGELYEGDIVFTEKQLKEIEAAPDAHAKRQAIMQGATAWGRTPISYSFKNVSASVPRVFRKAVAHWQAKTCVRFQENGNAKNRISVVNAGGCFSDVGMIGGEQTISLGGGCDTLSTTTHEIEHALGFWHEQSRADRDNYVTVKKDNIRAGSLNNFDKQETSSSLGVPYEYGSNMHYEAGAFTKNNLDTLIAKDSRYQNSMRGHMPSFYDIMIVNKFYKCDENCRTSTTKCQNYGVPDVNDCSKCICPEGYGGRYCETKPDVKCVVLLNATTTQNSYNFMMNTFVDQDIHDYCFYIVNAPAGRKVQLWFTYFGSDMASGCNTAGMEVKTLIDHRARGFQSCGFKPEVTYTSEGNRITIMAWKNNQRFVAGTFSYKAI